MPDISECIINLFNTWDDNSMKMKFSDVPANKKYYFLDWYRNSKKTTSSMLSRYMIDIMEGLFILNYSAFNSLFKVFDNIFYEWAIILFGPIILTFYALGLSIVDFGYLIYLVITGKHFGEINNPKLSNATN